MADISLKRQHALGLKAARTAADKMAARLADKFDLSGDWDGDVLRFSRPGVSGHLAITESTLSLEVTLGFLLKAMKGPIERAVHEQLDAVLADAKPAKTAAKAAVPAAGAKKAAKKK